MWNFKGHLWNFTQNFEPIHRKIYILLFSIFACELRYLNCDVISLSEMGPWHSNFVYTGTADVIKLNECISIVLALFVYILAEIDFLSSFIPRVPVSLSFFLLCLSVCVCLPLSLSVSVSVGLSLSMVNRKICWYIRSWLSDHIFSF